MIRGPSGSVIGHKTVARFAIFVTLLVLLCVGSTYDYLYSNSRNTVAVDNVDAQALSVKGHQVQQELRLEGKLGQLLLFCSAPSGAAYQDATVTFTVRQGEKETQTTVHATEISSPYVPDLALEKFGVGDATLTIQGSNFPEGTDLFFMASQTATSGLQAAQMDGSMTPGPLLMHYTVLRHGGYFIYDTVMLLALLAVIIGAAWLVVFRKEQISSGMGLFFCSFVLLFIYISLRNPVATFLAEPRSEMAYEFWYKAKYLPFFENLMSLMSGESLAWTERLMMWLAVQLSGDGQFVFAIAQLMQTVLVCAVSSMLCLPTFRKFLPAGLRLIICWYLGGAMLFPSAYYFWAVSYWACFFLIPFAFVDMERLKRWQYGLALAFSIVLCVSRIYHILLIPMALLALAALGKTRGKRFSLYCIVVALASAFEVGYSMIAGGSGHIDLSQLHPLRALANALYYQVQVLSSLFLGDGKHNGTLINMVFLLFFIVVLAAAVWLLICNWKNIEKRTYGCILMAMGILSFGSILINVVVCGCSNSVGFPVDYASAVDWNTTFYQNGDLHFSYSYFAIVLILLTLASFVSRTVSTNINLNEIKKTGVGAVIVLLFTTVNVQEYVPPRMIETSWKSCYWVTKNDSYYMPVNVSYPFANISLYHNSTSIICGMTDDGQEAAWAADHQAYSNTFEYTSAKPGKISDLPQRGMLSLTARRVNINFADPMVAVLLDSEGNELARISQTNTPDRYITDFMLEEPIYGVYAVSFQFEDGTPAYVCDGMQIGVAL